MGKNVTFGKGGIIDADDVKGVRANAFSARVKEGGFFAWKVQKGRRTHTLALSERNLLERLLLHLAPFLILFQGFQHCMYYNLALMFSNALSLSPRVAKSAPRKTKEMLSPLLMRKWNCTLEL